MPYADHQGVRIRYEVDGAGPPLVLAHGLSASLETWHELGYAQALKGTHRLILIDARGHGMSDKPHDPRAYSLAHDAADVVSVLDALQIETAHFFGYSMGGRTGIGIAKYAPARLRSLIVGGSGADESDRSEPPPVVQEWIHVLERGAEAWATYAESLFGPWWSPTLRVCQLANDPEALIARLSHQERVGLLGALPAVRAPCLIFAGEDDSVHAGAKRAAGALPRATFVSIPGLDHLGVLCRVDLVMPHLLQFLAAG